MAGLTGLFILVVGEIFAGPLMGWMGVPLEVREASELYLRVYLLGMPGMTLYDFLSAIYRSHGNVRTPLLSLVTASIVNIAGNLLAVFLGFGLAGVVIVTAIANYISSGLLLRLLRYEHGVLHFYPGAIRVRMEDIKEILRVGVPAGIQGMVFNFSNLVIQSAINSEGSLAMAASAAAYVLEINTYPFINAFGQAVTTFTSQNFGAGNIKRCLNVVKKGLTLNFGFTCFLTVLVFLAARPFLEVFGLEPDAMELGMMRVHIIIGFYFLSSIYESLAASMRGFGNSLAPALGMLVSIVGTRMLWLATVYEADPTFRNIMWCYPLSWFAADVLIGGLFVREMGKQKRLAKFDVEREPFAFRKDYLKQGAHGVSEEDPPHGGESCKRLSSCLIRARPEWLSRPRTRLSSQKTWRVKTVRPAPSLLSKARFLSFKSDFYGKDSHSSNQIQPCHAVFSFRTRYSASIRLCQGGDRKPGIFHKH